LKTRLSDPPLAAFAFGDGQLALPALVTSPAIELLSHGGVGARGAGPAWEEGLNSHGKLRRETT
jgi:hypothetical protein